MTKGGIASLWFFILIKMVKYLRSTYQIVAAAENTEPRVAFRVWLNSFSINQEYYQN